MAKCVKFLPAELIFGVRAHIQALVAGAPGKALGGGSAV